ncbi:MAG: hypothetical protein WB818_14700 [Desulfobacterales bacterium]
MNSSRPIFLFQRSASQVKEAVARLKERIDRIQAITRYENEADVQGKRIVDVIKYSADKP